MRRGGCPVMKSNKSVFGCLDDEMWWSGSGESDGTYLTKQLDFPTRVAIPCK